MAEVSRERRGGAWPGRVAFTLVVLVTCLWTFWGAGELYYEAWGLPLPEPLFYLVPAAACLLLSVLAAVRPFAGGIVILVVGGGFTLWWWTMMALRVGLDPRRALVHVPASALLVLVAVLFLLEGRRARRLLTGGDDAARAAYLRVRRRRLALATTLPLLVFAGVSAAELPRVLSRVDDGRRDARRIACEGVDLTWAPAGPGWNLRREGGWYPSWDHLALYGKPPVGLDLAAKFPGAPADRLPHASAEEFARWNLCRYLSGDGTRLEGEPVDAWRMPTADEVVRSLVHHGTCAGCTWDGRLPGRASCEEDPGKETPLWAPDQPPIYLWTGDEAPALPGEDVPSRAVYVSYRGRVDARPKDWGNSRHGYRCVREVPPGAPGPGH